MRDLRKKGVLKNENPKSCERKPPMEGISNWEKSYSIPSKQRKMGRQT